MGSYRYYEDDEDIVRQERKAYAKIRKDKNRGQDRCDYCAGSGRNNYGNLCNACQGVGLIKNKKFTDNNSIDNKSTDNT